MSGDLYARIQLLMSQRRFDLARQDLGRLLASEPRDATAQSMMAMCMLQQDQQADALRVAQTAISIEPDDSYGHLVLAFVHLRAGRSAEAIASADEVLRLDASESAAHVIISRAQLIRQKYAEALSAADAGLAIAPEDVDLLNNRAVALERLGRVDESIAVGRQTLARDPDDSYSHATYGWTLVNAGRHTEAQQAFREALRLDPSNDYARQGMITALNSRSRIFRGIHYFYVRMNRLGGRTAFFLFVAAWLSIQLISRNADRLPFGEYWVLPLIVLYVGFAIMTWIATPLFNTVLRFHPLGRHLLTRKQFWESNVIAPTAALMLFSILVLPWWFGIAFTLLAAVYWMGMLPLIAIVFRMDTTPRIRFFAIACGLVAALPLWGLWQSISVGSTDPLMTGFRQYGIGVLGLQFASSMRG